MLILYGDNPIESRNYLTQQISHHKDNGVKDILNIDGKKTDIQTIIQAFESASLFGTDRLIIIENLFSRPKSTLKSDILSYIKKASPTNLIIWEDKKINTNSLKSFKSAQIKEFKTPPVIFSFLDGIGKNKKQTLEKLQQSINQSSPESVFYMISRQVRLMLQTLDENFKLPSWQKNKLSSQLKSLGKTKVLWLHHQLLIIDEKIKTGQNPLGLQAELELLFSKL